MLRPLLGFAELGNEGNADARGRLQVKVYWNTYVIIKKTIKETRRMNAE
jgi:hypothetical protein